MVRIITQMSVSPLRFCHFYKTSPVASVSSPSSAAPVARSPREGLDLHCRFEDERCGRACPGPSSCCQAFATWRAGSGTTPANFHSKVLLSILFFLRLSEVEEEEERLGGDTVEDAG